MFHHRFARRTTRKQPRGIGSGLQLLSYLHYGGMATKQRPRLGNGSFVHSVPTRGGVRRAGWGAAGGSGGGGGARFSVKGFVLEFRVIISAVESM